MTSLIKVCRVRKPEATEIINELWYRYCGIGCGVLLQQMLLINRKLIIPELIVDVIAFFTLSISQIYLLLFIKAIIPSC